MSDILENKSMNRKILLSENVSGSSMKVIIEKIIEINKDDDEKEEKLNNYERKPIELFINSFGGSVYDGLALVDIMLISTTPVHTISIGSSMSMGLILFLAGEKRFITKNSTLMYHEVATGNWGKLESFKLEVEEMQRLQDIMDNMVLENTNVLKEKLEEIKERQKEWYIPAEEAVKLGFAHEIIKAKK